MNYTPYKLQSSNDTHHQTLIDEGWYFERDGYHFNRSSSESVEGFHAYRDSEREDIYELFEYDIFISLGAQETTNKPPREVHLKDLLQIVIDCPHWKEYSLS